MTTALCVGHNLKFEKIWSFRSPCWWQLKKIKRPTHISESGRHLRNRSATHTHISHRDTDVKWQYFCHPWKQISTRNLWCLGLIDDRNENIYAKCFPKIIQHVNVYIVKCLPLWLKNHFTHADMCTCKYFKCIELFRHQISRPSTADSNDGKSQIVSPACNNRPGNVSILQITFCVNITLFCIINSKNTAVGMFFNLWLKPLTTERETAPRLISYWFPAYWKDF